MKYEEMFSLIQEWQLSGLKKSDFLADKSCSPKSFNFWLKRYNTLKSLYQTETISDFQEIHLPVKTDREENKILELTRTSGTHIVIFG